MKKQQKVLKNLRYNLSSQLKVMPHACVKQVLRTRTFLSAHEGHQRFVKHVRSADDDEGQSVGVKVELERFFYLIVVPANLRSRKTAKDETKS